MNVQHRPDTLLDTSDGSAAASWDDLLTRQVDLFGECESEAMRGIDALRTARRVLDVGCGNGAYLAQLRERYPEKDYIGMDVSPAFIEMATRRHGRPGLRFQEGDFLGAAELPASDVLILRFVVQYLECGVSVLRRSAEALDQGGTVIIIEPDMARSVVRPSMPMFVGMLSAFEARQEAAGRLRTRLDELRRAAESNPSWDVAADRIATIDVTTEMQVGKTAAVFDRWIDLCERAGDFAYPFNSTRQELTDWSIRPEASAGIALRIIALRYTPRDVSSGVSTTA